jgi:cadaverine:lysine antiporter
MTATPKKIGLLACIGVVAGNMMGSGIALLPANLAHIGSVSIWSWVICMFGAMCLAYVYARLGTVNPQQGGPIAYAGEVSPAFGFQTGVLYYHANWIGNLAIAITGVAYMSTFFPILNQPWPATIASVVIVWIFTFVNLLGGSWVSRLTSMGLILILIPVVLTATMGWGWFDVHTYMANWNTSGKTDSSAMVSAVILCLWAFVGVESASVSTGLVENPKRTVPLATMLGTGLAGLVYIASTQAISGMFPAKEMAASGAPFALATSHMFGSWAAPLVSAFAAFACFTSLGSWMMLVGEAGRRAAADGNFPAIYGKTDAKGVARAGLLLASVKMTALLVLLNVFAGTGNASGLFNQLTSIAVLLTLLPYFYSCVNLIRFEGMTTKSVVSMIACVVGAAFCLVGLAGADATPLMGTFLVSLIILMFYARKMGQRQAADVKASA